MEYQSKVLDKELKKEEFTTSSLINEQKYSIKAKTVEEFYLSLIEDLKQKGRIGNNYAYLNPYINHSSVTITKRYLGLRQEEILQTYDSLNF